MIVIIDRISDDSKYESKSISGGLELSDIKGLIILFLYFIFN